MKKTDWKYLVDTLLFISTGGIVFIGLLMGFVLAEGPSVGTGKSKYFLSLHRHQWGTIHFILSLAFTVLLIIHLWLGWGWVKGKSKRLFKGGWAAALGFVVFLSAFALLIGWLASTKNDPYYKSFGAQTGLRWQLESEIQGRQTESEEIGKRAGGVVIRGNTTLAELESSTWIPLQKILEELGLPSNIPKEETLGQIGQRYGITTREIRDRLTATLSGTGEPVRPISPAGTEARQKVEAESVTAPPPDPHDEEEPKVVAGRLSENQPEFVITGQMTLLDIEKGTGISAAAVLKRLGLPESAPLDMTLGRLRKLHAFSIQDVRDIVAALLEEKRK